MERHLEFIVKNSITYPNKKKVDLWVFENDDAERFPLLGAFLEEKDFEKHVNPILDEAIKKGMNLFLDQLMGKGQGALRVSFEFKSEV